MSDVSAPAAGDVQPTAAKSPKKKATAKKVSGAKKAKAPSDHPTYIEMIQQAVAGLKERGGSSRQAILKYIMKNFKVGDDENMVNVHLKMALRSGVKNDSLKQMKGTGASGSFKLGVDQAKEAAKEKKKAVTATKKPKAAAVAKKSTTTATKKPKAAAAVKKPKTSAVKKPVAAKKASPKKAMKPKAAATKKPSKAASVKPAKKAKADKPTKVKASAAKKVQAGKPAKAAAKKPAASKKA